MCVLIISANGGARAKTLKTLSNIFTRSLSLCFVLLVFLGHLNSNKHYIAHYGSYQVLPT